MINTTEVYWYYMVKFSNFDNSELQVCFQSLTTCK